MFILQNVPGALASAINVISSYGFNMKVIRSRPIKEPAWEYYFYVEAEGDEGIRERPPHDIRAASALPRAQGRRALFG